MMRLAVLVPLLFLAACAGVSQFSAETAARTETRILLTVAEPRSGALALEGPPGRRYLRRPAYGPSPSVDRVLDALAREHGLRRVDGWPIQSLDVYCEVFAVREGVALEPLLKALAADSRVQLAQRMNTFQTLSRGDPYAGLQPSIVRLGLSAAHGVATGKGVLVAVIDSAVDAEHPALVGHVSFERDFVDGGRKPRGGEVHGTAVAGIIGSALDNREGIVGVAPDARIAALRACRAVNPGSSAATCTSFSLAKALETAIEIRAGVINLSLAGPRDPLLEALVAAALKGGAIVLAAAPGPGEEPGFPASEPRVLVARTSSTPASPSARSLPAPGDEILTTVPGRGYAFLSGSSLAAAQISGVVALLVERRPKLRAENAAAVLEATTVRAGRGESVNACFALEKLVSGRFCPDGLAAQLTAQ